MNLDAFVIGILVILLIGSNVYWAKICFSLLNRVMSRDYAQFVTAERNKSSKPGPPPQFTQDFTDPVAERHAQELNATFGMGI